MLYDMILYLISYIISTFVYYARGSNVHTYNTNAQKEKTP